MSQIITPRLSLVHYTYLILALILIIASPATAQDCGCDHLITPNQGYIRATDMPEVKPGDVICIQAGVRSRLKFIGFQGTKEQPLIFKNCGGQVIFDRNSDGTTLEGQLLFEKSRYFRVTGTGSPDHKYGFLIRKSNGSALHANDSDFEIDHVEIADAGFAGIFAKVEALCNNTEFHRGNFVMNNISIHDNYVHDTHGEGMYIGSSWWHGKQMECGMLFPPELHNLKVYNNIVENTGADGMQIGCAAKNAEVYNNTIRNYGFNPFSPVHTNGLMLNGGFQGKVYNNQIFDGAGMGLNCFGSGDVQMYNNLVVRAGTDGIFIDERGPVTPGTGFHTHNNTVVSPKRDGIRIYSRNSTGNTFVNNLVVAPGSLGTNYYNKDQYLFIIDDQVDYTQKNNLFLATVEEAQFVNPAANDYQLKATSTAIDKGALLSYIAFDFNREARPQGAGFDIGAYEFGGAAPIENVAPVVTAGEDKTLTLPTSSTSLTATATDADGTIASYNWSKISGPAATLSGTATASVSLSGLVEGTYVFRITAKDNKGATATDDVQIFVKAAPVANLAPAVQAGTDKTITLPTNSLQLIGTASDTDGTLASTSWTKVSGPAATLSGASSLNLGLSGLVEGIYVFRLTASDDDGASASDDVTVKVDAAPVVNVAPVVQAGADKSITLPTNSLQLTGSASDTDGTLASTSWTKVSGPAATLSGASSLNLGLSGLVEGVYTFRLTATDNDGTSASDDMIVTVEAAPVVNVAPKVYAGADQTLTLPTNSITLNATASDADGSISDARWTKISGPAATLSGTTTQTLGLSGLIEGEYTFRYSATDNSGASAWDEVLVSVLAAPATAPLVTTNGLTYYYYTSAKKNTWNNMPDFSAMTPSKSDITPTITLAPKTQNDYFGFVFAGFLEIKETGTYTFYTLSDEGSELYINNQLIANNEGASGVRERKGTLYLAAGFYPIKLNYYDKNNGEKLEVSYAGPGFGRKLIPSAVLYPVLPEAAKETPLEIDEAVKAYELPAPDNLQVRYNSEKGTAYLTWNDNSSIESGFEVFMATGSEDAAYKVAGSTTASKINYTVVNLIPGERYYIKVRARTRIMFSEYSNLVSVNDEQTGSVAEVQTGQRILINFNYGKNAAAPWNNFDQDPDAMDLMTNIKDERGNSTPLNLKLLTPWGWANTGGNGWNNVGATTGDNSGVYPDEVMKSSFWTERTEAEIIEVSGLKPNEYYRFTFFGSRDGSGDRTTHYRIGKKTVTLNASYNTSKTVNIANAKANANGTVTVYVQKGETALFGYLNAMVVEATGYIEGIETAAARMTADAEPSLERSQELGSAYQHFSAYPNPATDHLILHYKQTTPFSKIHIQVIDLTGNVRMASEETANDENGQIRIDLEAENIASGYYILKIQSESGTKTIKIFKL